MMIKDVLVFTPVYRLEPETVDAIFALEWDGPISFLFQRDNPHPGTGRETGVRNHLHQYRRGREAFLQGRYDAMLTIESDIIPPPDTLKRLAALDADVAYGAYVFRNSPVLNLFHVYAMPPAQRARNVGKSLSITGGWPPKQDVIDVSGAGLGCTLIKRHVLEAIDFRTLQTLSPGAHCDSWFTADVWKRGYTMKADTRVVCGHKREDGEVLWPPS